MHTDPQVKTLESRLGSPYKQQCVWDWDGECHFFTWTNIPPVNCSMRQLATWRGVLVSESLHVHTHQGGHRTRQREMSFLQNVATSFSGWFLLSVHRYEYPPW